MTTQWLLLGLVIVLLAASAFFVAAEFALIAARRSIIEPLAVNSARARSTLKAMEHVSLMMACAQLGITLCGVLLGALGEPAVAALLDPVFHSLGVPEAWLHPVSLVIALLLVVSAHVAFGEMVPKNIAIAGPERTALVLAPTLQAIATGIGPIIRSLNWFANSVVRLTGREPKDEVASAFTLEEVAGLVAESRREGLLDDEEHQLITSALGFDTSVVSSVMVPVGEVEAIRETVTPAEIERMCARTGFSRFPIDRPDSGGASADRTGGFAGYLHIRDVVDIPADRRDDRPLPQGPQGVTGLLRLSQPDGAFLRANDPQAGRWYSRDTQAIAASLGLSDVAPYFIDADRAGDAQPIGGLTVIAFRNPHLTYALTWFAMAGGLLILVIYALRR